jgi:CRISPR/Cas system-associated exonuclease Cas4 (RecB family)
MRSLGLNPRRAAVHHLDSGKKDYVDITTGKIEETKKNILKRIDCILGKKFPPILSKEKCAGCDYEKMCPMKNL